MSEFKGTLNAGSIEGLFKHCLFLPGEPTDNAVKVDGVVSSFGFHPERLEGGRHLVADWLQQLPEQFQYDKGGGWSFLQACVDKDGRQWGEHRNIEQLMCLGLALGLVTMLMPKEMWSVLPGGMPYFMVAPPATAIAQSP